MCGIAGIIVAEGEVREEEIQAITGHLRHRGPDAQGLWCASDHRTALGHTRLSILDLRPEAGQPMLTPDGRYVLVFNGEIYNFLELAAELRGRGYRFRTESDTEVLLHGWDLWGTAMFDRLNGMWALALHDTSTGETQLCRDRFGIKPLYYFEADGRLVFASEMQAIDRFFGYRLPLAPSYFKSLASLTVGEQGYLEGVRALLPGHLVRVTSGRADVPRRWYTLGQVEVPPRFTDQAARLRELALDAIRLRLRSDVPVATCLSGGLDSGSIVSLLHHVGEGDARFPGFNHRSFTAAFPGTPLDETAAVRELASVFELQSDTETIGPPGPNVLEEALRACDGPMPTMAFFPIWQLYRHIRAQGTIVTLDGIGPDEVLGGYYIGADALRSAIRSGRSQRVLDVFRTYAALGPDAGAWMRNDLQSAARQEGSRLKQRLRARFGRGSGPHPGPALPVWVPSEHPLRADPLAQILWRQFFESPLPFYLQQYDRAAMASGVESRMPFMDYRMVEYLFSLPLESRIGNGFTKRVLREAVRGILPEHIRLNRQKIGFNAPFGSWFSGPLREWMLDISSSTIFIDNPYFDGRATRLLAQASAAGTAGEPDERRVWPALHIAWWMMQRQARASEPALSRDPGRLTSASSALTT